MRKLVPKGGIASCKRRGPPLTLVGGTALFFSPLNEEVSGFSSC
jgi:hypothetical protein